MTLQQLRYLVAVADHGSITAAAAAMFVAQPALSRAIRALERELNAELFARDGRGVVFTADGARVVRLARSVLDTVEVIEDLSRPSVADRREILRIVTTPTLTVDLSSKLIPAFTECHPEVRVEMVSRDGREVLVQALYDGIAELGLVDLPVDDALKAHRMTDREVVLISPPGTFLPDPVPPEALERLPLVMPTRGTGRRAEFESMFTYFGVRPIPALETDERVAWVAGVLDGLGSLIWYRDVARRAFGDRAEIRSFDPPLGRTTGLVHQRRPLSRAARGFLLFARQVRPHPAPIPN